MPTTYEQTPGCTVASTVVKGLRQELALMSMLDVMVSMDSANMHLASLVATPVVSVWGATHPYAGFMGWRQSEDNAVQLDMDCRPCSIYGNKPCIHGNYPCMKQIEPETIVARIVPTTVEIVDIAGLVKGASKGEGLGNQFLGNIRETDAIIHVLRCFDDDNVVHVDGSVDPVRDKEIIDTELQLKDLETIENRLRKVEKIAQVGGDKNAKLEYDVLCAYREALLQGKSARTVQFESKDEEKAARGLFLLTSKPVLYVCNVDEASAKAGNKYVEAVKNAVAEENAEVLVLAAQTEADIAELESYEERQMFLEDVGLEESGCNRLIKAAYKMLELETFITAGEMEVKAWTYRKGWKAPQCAGVIHTDFEKGFIRAEVIKYDDYIKYGSEAAVRDAGLLHVEGKEYVVQDGDIMHFRFNV